MWKKLSRDEELTAEQARHRSRAFSVFVDGDGMYVVKGRLEPEVGAVLMRAIEAASDALFRGEGDARDGAGSGRSARREASDARPEPKQRRADAVGLLAERALAAGFGDSEPGDDPPTQSREEQRAQLDIETPASPRVESGTRAERYQVMVHCDAATLAAEGETGRSGAGSRRRIMLSIGPTGARRVSGIRCCSVGVTIAPFTRAGSRYP